MKVLVLTPWFPNAVNDQHGNFVLDSIESLCAAGHRVHVLVTRPYVPRCLSKGRQGGCMVISPEMSRRGFSLECVEYLSIPRNHLRFVSNRLYVAGCVGAVKRAVRERAIEVIHAHTEMAGYLACKVADAPVVMTLHGINRDRRYLFGAGQPAFLRRAFTFPQRLVLVGRALCSFVGQYLEGTGHVRIVHNGFRSGEAMPCRHRRVFGSADSIQIVSVSNLVEGKGIDTNLAVLGSPEVARLPNWHYHVVGDGTWRPRLEAMARELGIAQRVSFHGRIGHKEVYGLLARCDVFSLPSSPEAFGVAYLEAMACGLLAIGVAGQGPTEFIEHGRTGLLVGERDVKGLTALLLGVLNNPRNYADMAESGREHVWKNFTWQTHAAAMTKVFEEALTQPAFA